jgi:N6-adenosine-specific RNA methylase IME4
LNLPDKKYKIIYADPPWSYRNKKTGGSMNSGSQSKYSTLSLKEICTLPVKTISEKDSILFLWATVPLLPEALEVMKNWGFHYKTALFWRKIMTLGMGFWFRGQVEILLMGVRGRVKAFRIQKPNFIQARVREHSRKPDEFRNLIEETGLNPRIELFAREETKDWDVWGNETTKFNNV